MVPTIRSVDLRYYQDPESGQPHIHRHGVLSHEVEEVLTAPLEDRAGRRESRVAIGQTEAGRFLRVIYVPAEQAIFVVTAFDLGPKSRKALRRRVRKRQ